MSAAGFWRGEAEAVVEQRGAEADGDGEVGGPRSSASPVSSGGASCEAAAPAPIGWPPAIVAAAAVHSREQLAQLGRRGAVGDVEGGEVQPILGGRGDAGLVLAVEVDDVAVAVGRASSPSWPAA